MDAGYAHTGLCTEQLEGMGPELSRQICCLLIKHKSYLYSETSIKQVMYLFCKAFELVEESCPGLLLHNLVPILHLTEYSGDHL